MYVVAVFSVGSWEEPFDSTLYCIRSDQENMIVAGTARYGMARLWDKRSTKPVQVRLKIHSNKVKVTLMRNVAKLGLENKNWGFKIKTAS